MSRKVCVACYSAAYPGQKITKITLGRQCAICQKTTERSEQLIPIEPEESDS